MVPKREIKDIYHGATAREIVLAGVTELHESVASTYGPGGYNVLQGMVFGDPVLTRDGVTVAKRVILANRSQNDAAAVLRQASEKTNKTAGDGTTATIVLGYHLLKAAHERIAAGENGMVLKREIEADAKIVIDHINKVSQPVEDHLLEVATVSSGSGEIGQLVADTMADVGVDGGITIREHSYPGIDVEKVNGYYFDRGFFALNTQIEYEKPLILVSMKRFASNADILPLLEMVVTGSNRKLVIVGEVSGDALNTFLQNVIQGKFDGVIIPPPAFGDESKLFMEDIATYVGSQVLMQGDSADDIAPYHFGSAGRVQVNQDRAIVFQGEGDADTITTRAADIKQNIEAETNAHRKDQLESRYSKLVSKIAIVNVGGSTPAEMEELRFRVEDAIEATKSAMLDGVLPGGATVLVKASQLKIGRLFAVALRATFRQLMDNAAEDAGYRIRQIDKAPFGEGFNLRAMTEEPIDLTEAGIWDATRAVVQTIENATSAAGALMTVNTLITPRDEEAKA